MFDQCLYFNTTALARTLEREWTIAFKPFGLTPSQAFMLRTVLRQPGLLQSEVAATLSISRSTATRTLDGLQRLKLIERRATERDGREFQIIATAKGEALKEKLNIASGEVTKCLKKILGAREFENAVKDVRKIHTALK